MSDVRAGSPLRVRDHAFGRSEPWTVGVEEEYMLLHPESLDLVQRVEGMLAAERGGQHEADVAPELFQSELEAHTPVCRSIAELDAALRELRAHVAGTAAAQRLAIGSAGTHPFAYYEDQAVTDRERYRALIEELQWSARRELIFGLHVHVAVPDAEAAVAALRGLGAHLGELVALSASSPVWRGSPTGVSSSRLLVYASMPRTGPPPQLASWEEYAGLVERLQAVGAIHDYTRIWWDVRLHPRFGTVEVRVMDAVPRVEDAIALAAYVQALVRHYVERPPDALPLALVGEDKWRGVRYGLDGELLDLPAGGERPVPARERVERTLALVEPAARELCTLDALAGIRRILDRGNASSGLMAVWDERHDVRDLMAAVVAATAGVPVAA